MQMVRRKIFWLLPRMHLTLLNSFLLFSVIRQSLSFPHSREDGRFVTAVLNNITYINKVC